MIVKIDPKTNRASIGGVNFSPKEVLLFILQGAIDMNIRPDLRAELQEANDYLKNHLKDLKVESIRGDKLKTTIVGSPDTPEVRKKIRTILKAPLTEDLIQYIKVIQTGLKRAKEKEGPKKYKIGGHYLDQKLTHSYERDQKQLSLFDILSPQTLDKIKEEEVSVEGIRLSVAEEKLLNSILKILQDKSTKGQAGNEPPSLEDYGGQKERAPLIRFTPHELYTEVAGTKDYSGEEMRYIKNTLLQLQDRKFLIIYKRHRWEKKGKEVKEVIDRIEEYLPLLRIKTYFEGITKEEDRKLDQGDQDIRNEKGEIILALNPIFTDQINTKFIEIPTDINRITAIASGGPKRVTTAIIRLRDYLLRSITNNKKQKRATIQIDKDRLPYILGLEIFIKQRRKKLIELRTTEAIKACLNLGLITKVNEITGAEGQSQYEFILNLEY